ncbi:MAG: type II toxin-antitoxin system HicA family toxin [Pseudomonadota bacterium]
MPLSGKEIVRLLHQHGWELARVKGSHHIMKKGAFEISVPVHGNRSLGTGLERKILKTAGLKRK